MMLYLVDRTNSPFRRGGWYEYLYQRVRPIPEHREARERAAFNGRKRANDKAERKRQKRATVEERPRR